MVTREQVERLAKARIEYDEAMAAFDESYEGPAHVEIVRSAERLIFMAEAAGAEVGIRPSDLIVDARFEAFGVEFSFVASKDGR